MLRVTGYELAVDDGFPGDTATPLEEQDICAQVITTHEIAISAAAAASAAASALLCFCFCFLLCFNPLDVLPALYTDDK